MPGPSTPSGIAAPLVYYPRAFVVLKIVRPNGDDFESGFTPTSAEWTLPPHHEASTCEVTIETSALTFDPRSIHGIAIQLFMGAVRKVDDDVRKVQYLRFVGYVDSLDEEFTNKGLCVRLKARDLSSVLRDIKPLPISLTPKYSDTIQQAINRIVQGLGIDATEVDITDNGAGLLTRTLATSVAARHQSGYVPLKREVTAWEAIEHACGLLNVLVSVDLGKIVLRKPTDAFGNDKGILLGSGAGYAPPTPAFGLTAAGTAAAAAVNTALGQTDSAYTFVFGEEGSNLLRVSYSKKFLRNRKGVRVISYDPTTRRAQYADFPSDALLLSRKRPKLGSTKQSHPRKTNQVNPPPRDVFSIPDGVHTKDALQSIAERIYRERSRQELDCHLETPVWDDDLFKLRNGSRITVKVTPRLEAELRNTKNTEAAVKLLKERMQMDEQTARALFNAIKNRESSLFYAHTIHHSWSMDRASTHVQFINLIDL